MKFAEEIYPVGTFDRQQTAGAYIDETLSKNLDVYAKNINKDMHFLGLISGHDMVGNGKTTLATHVGSYLTYRINKMHNLNNSFSYKNILLNSKDLIERSFELPKHSVILLDEGDDVTTHGMKALAVSLKRYFRKCRQLNQIILIILPSFFEFPLFYAMNRSHFLIDVSFKGEFDRGFFRFYGPSSKKNLYLNGKKTWDYNAGKFDFEGRFFSEYCFLPEVKSNTEEYLKIKYSDMVDDAQEQAQKSPEAILLEWKQEVSIRLRETFPDIESQKLADVLGVSRATFYNWIKPKMTENPSKIVVSTV